MLYAYAWFSIQLGYKLVWILSFGFIIKQLQYNEIHFLGFAPIKIVSGCTDKTHENKQWPQKSSYFLSHIEKPHRCSSMPSYLNIIRWNINRHSIGIASVPEKSTMRYAAPNRTHQRLIYRKCEWVMHLEIALSRKQQRALKIRSRCMLHGDLSAMKVHCHALNIEQSTSEFDDLTHNWLRRRRRLLTWFEIRLYRTEYLFSPFSGTFPERMHKLFSNSLMPWFVYVNLGFYSTKIYFFYFYFWRTMTVTPTKTNDTNQFLS